MKSILFNILALVCLVGYSQSRDVFPGISLGQSLESVHDQLKDHADTLYRIKVAKAVFPLSEYSEDHLICLDYQTDSGSIEEVAFTFADDKLSLIQAKGGAVRTLTGKRKDTAEIFMDYKVYWDDLIVTDHARDKVWILSPEAAHPNLFAWDNPICRVMEVPKYTISHRLKYLHLLRWEANLKN